MTGRLSERRFARRAITWITSFALALASGMPSADSIDEAGAAATGAEARRRPRIALVLSGGGARGASHIGILQVMEELRIPIDYVTGLYLS